MSLIAKMRNRQRPSVQGLFFVFALTWLSLALQPCVMAAAVLSGAAVENLDHQHDTHTDISQLHADENDCPHCTMLRHDMCDGGGDCGQPDLVQPNGKIELEDSALKILVSWQIAPIAHVPRNSLAVDIDPCAESPPPSASVQVLYCVYLK